MFTFLWNLNSKKVAARASDFCVIKTQNAFDELYFSGTWGADTNTIFAIGKRLINSLTPATNDVDKKKYDQIVIGTIIVALAREDLKYGQQEQYDNEFLYKKMRLPQLWNLYFEVHPHARRGDDWHASIEEKMTILISFVGEKAADDKSFYENEICGNFLSDLSAALPIPLAKAIFYYNKPLEDARYINHHIKPYVKMFFSGYRTDDEKLITNKVLISNYYLPKPIVDTINDYLLFTKKNNKGKKVASEEFHSELKLDI